MFLVRRVSVGNKENFVQPELLEGALRAANAVSPSFIFYSDSFGRYRGKPGSPHHGTVLNSRGFNDVERSVSRPPHVRTRIVALGDSFAFGVVPYADNYLTLTERGLASDGSVEVINMGVSATDPRDYRAILVDEGLAYRPDLNARGCYGRTALHYAVHEGGNISIPIVGLLLAMGADPLVRDDNGFSVEDWAKIEMYEGLDGVLDMLRRSPTRQPASDE